MGAFQIEESALFIYTVYPLLLLSIFYFGFREIRRALPLWKTADRLALGGVTLLAIVQLLLHSDLVNDFWGPGQQNWKFEYNAVAISQLGGAVFEHIHHHGSSFLMTPFFLIFGQHHTSVIYMNSILFVLLTVSVFMASREIFNSWRAGLVAGLFVPFYDPILALWPAGGEYLAAFSLGMTALWLLLRNLREGNVSSFVIAALVLQLASMMRMEIIFLWVVWFAGAYLAETYPRRMLKHIFIFGSFSLMISSLAFDTFFTPREAMSDMRLWENIGSYLLFLSDTLIVLLAFIPGLHKLLKIGNSSAYSLLLMLLIYSLIILSGPSSDKNQLSAYFFIPICIIAGGVALYLPRKVLLFSGLIIPFILLNALPKQQCVWGSVDFERDSDMAIRRLVETLPEDMKLMLNPTYSEIAFGSIRSPFSIMTTAGKVMQSVAGKGPFACFHHIDMKDGCWYVEMFRDVRQVALESLSSIEPLEYGCRIVDSRRDAQIEMRIYDCPEGAYKRKAVQP